MEIERKFLVKEDGFPFRDYPCHEMEQGYLSTDPVVRVRKSDDDYYLTYKGRGKMVREEANLPLTKESYYHMIKKADGRIISKTRYLIPYNGYTIELDVFHGDLAPLIMAEIEFPTEEEAISFVAPEWFIKDVTDDPHYHNSNMSKADYN